MSKKAAAVGSEVRVNDIIGIFVALIFNIPVPLFLQHLLHISMHLDPVKFIRSSKYPVRGLGDGRWQRGKNSRLSVSSPNHSLRDYNRFPLTRF